MLMIRLTFQNS